jgi:hypothetical protein
MPQKFSDLSQRCSLSKHLTGETVTELMGSLTRRINPGSCERVPDHGTDRLVALEATCRCPAAEKHTSTGALRPAASQIVGNRLADIHGERQLGTAASLSAYCDGPGLPVQVLQSESGDLTGTQPQSGEQKNNCKIPLALRRLSVAGCQHQLDLLSGKGSGYRRERPVCDGRNTRCEVGIQISAISCESQKRA